jgi:YidC/Oxa1 family membrane protein insertase
MGDSASLHDASIMITDWSGAGVEFALGLEKPVLFIDVPPKTRNDTWPELGIEPFEMRIRKEIGAVVSPSALDTVPEVIQTLVTEPAAFSEAVASLRSSCVFNLGRSADAAAEAIVKLAADAATATASQP